MDTFLNGLSGAIGGAIGGLLGFMLAQFMNWRNRPRLKIELDCDDTGNPHFLTHMISEDGWRTDVGIERGGYANGLFMRVRVLNVGRVPALNCEARFRVYSIENGKRKQEPDSGLLHWAIREPTLEQDNQFAPLHLNPKAPPESLDLLMLPCSVLVTYESGSEKRDTYYSDELRVYSVRPCPLGSGKDYEIEVTVSANNTAAKPFTLRLNWNGTPEHFESGEFILR